jgi:hypothetical protein
MRTVIFQGRERALVDLCREHGIDRRTVASRLSKGVSIEEAVTTPPRNYPVKRSVQVPEAPPRHPVIQDGIDLMLDARGIMEALEPTPRRQRVIAGMTRWLLGVGWR